MVKVVAATALAACIAVAVAFAGRPAPVSGNWQVDNGHSDARITVDGTTDYGKTQTKFTVGYTRAIGTVRLDKDDPTKSSIDFKLYPAGSMAPVMDEDGMVKKSWLITMANHTLICFHSKSVTATGDDKLKAAGTLTVTRVDRNVEMTPSEAYAGPVYGPPIIHRVSREETFLFSVPSDSSGSEVLLKGSTHVTREDFPQLVTSVLNTYWPPVVQDKKCDFPATTTAEDYSGSRCTGMLVDDGVAAPQAPTSPGQEDIGTATNFNAVTGQSLSIHVHLRLSPAGAAVAKAGQ